MSDGPLFSMLWQSEEDQHPITVLGNEYDNTQHQREIQGKIWLTYRFGFEPIAREPTGPAPLSFVHLYITSRNLIMNTLQNLGSVIDNDNFTSDVGWGCMIRTSQNLLANTFLHLLKQPRQVQHIHDIVDLFQDTSKAPFSLHNFIRVAGELPLKVKPGEWFGPNAASLSIKRLCDNFTGHDLPEVSVLICESGDLYDSHIERMLLTKTNLLILFPVRLGIDKFNLYYSSSLYQLLALPQSVGIAGGKPSSSFYFMGYQGESLIYLNPHVPQPYNSDTDYTTYHTSNYQKLDIADLDPSMMVGIAVQNLDDYLKFKAACLAANNKIVHFHDFERRANKERKNSDYVHVTNEDEFVALKRESDDFVDLGDVASIPEDDEDIQQEVDEAIQEELWTEPAPNTEEIVNISHSNLESFETMQSTDLQASPGTN